MSFLTQGNTNWKFIGIVVVLAIIVGGGIWFLSIPKPSRSMLLREKQNEEIKVSEEIIEEEKIRISDMLLEEIIGKIGKDPEFTDWFTGWQATNPLLSIDDFLTSWSYPYEESMWARFITEEEENVNIPCPEWASRIIRQPREIYSPDKTKYIYFPCAYGEADNGLWLYNRKDDKKMERIGYYGPSAGFHGAFWIDDERFVVLSRFIMTLEKHSIYVSYWDLTDEQRIIFEIAELNPKN